MGPDRTNLLIQHFKKGNILIVWLIVCFTAMTRRTAFGKHDYISWEWGPVRVLNDRQTPKHVAVFLSSDVRGTTSRLWHVDVCVLQRERSQGYSTHLISVCLRPWDYVLFTSLTLFFLLLLYVCFLRARSGTSSEKGLPLSKSIEGFCKLVANTWHIFFCLFICSPCVFSCVFTIPTHGAVL